MPPVEVLLDGGEQQARGGIGCKARLAVWMWARYWSVTCRGLPDETLGDWRNVFLSV
jgi:hypothetical protein